MQRRDCTGRRFRHDITAAGKQGTYDVGSTVLAGKVKGSVSAHASACFQVGPRNNEKFGDSAVAIFRRPVKRRHAIALRCVDVLALLHKLRYTLYVFRHGSIGYQGIGERGC